MLPPEYYSSLQNKTEEEESTNLWDMTGTGTGTGTGTSLWSRISPFLILNEATLYENKKGTEFFHKLWFL